MYKAYDRTSRRLSDASSFDLSIRSWTATKWLGSDIWLPQVLEGGSYEPNEPPSVRACSCSAHVSAADNARVGRGLRCPSSVRDAVIAVVQVVSVN